MSWERLRERPSARAGITVVGNEGRWSASELLLLLLERYPGSDVRLSSFSIGEGALRALQDERIRSLTVVLDRSMARHRVALLEFARRTCGSVYLGDNHSKLLLLDSGRSRAAFVGSQNYTRNRRFEVGVLLENCPEVDHVSALFGELLAQSYRL